MWKPAPPPKVRITIAEQKAKKFFADRGIKPTLAEFREVCACMRNGSNPMGIH